MPKLIFRSNYWGNEPAVHKQSFNKDLGNTNSQNRAPSDSKLKMKEKHKAVNLGQKADDSEDNENRKAAIDMQEYNYSDIVKIDKFGIEFNDGRYINFEECKKEWAEENGILPNETACVATRNQENNYRYFIFYSEERVRINYKYRGFFKDRRSREKYCEMQMMLNKFGYTSYDMT